VRSMSIDHELSSIISFIKAQLHYHEKELAEMRSAMKRINDEVTTLKVEIAKLHEIISTIKEDIKESNKKSMWRASLISSILVASISIIVNVLVRAIP